MIINSPIIQNTGSLVTIDGQKVTDALDLYGFNETVTISSDTSLLVSPDISYKEYLLNNNNNLYIKTITNNENNNFKFDI